MSEIGKKVRLSQLFNAESGNSVMVAMDHGVVIGPVEGIVDPVQTVKMLSAEKPDTFFMPNGIIKRVYPHFIDNRVPFIVAIDTCTFLGPEPDYFMVSDSVEHAMSLGATAVSMHVMVGSDRTSDMLKGLAKVCETCDKLGMPLLAIMYPVRFENNFDVKVVKWVARIAAELGADLVKTYYTGSTETFHEVVASCPIPVLLSGGDPTETPGEFLGVLKNTIDAGGRGCAVGRNVWQNKRPRSMLRAVQAIVHQHCSVEDALEIYQRPLD
jgi:fructose-bisphosphate aldolase/2-amino-3,7-dideoxy-D-threo-hept-6-ulosonate synthase